MNIDDYIDAQPENLQPILKAVRETIKAALPEAQEKISYGMPTFWHRHNLIHFAAMKHHLGIYPGDGGVNAFIQEIEQRGLKYSKGTIQFPFGKVDLELIERIAEWCGRNYG